MIPIAAKATQRAEQRNNLTTGMNSNNPFTILNATPNDVLKKVIQDLDIEIDDVDGQINLFKAEELLRADLAQANYKEYLARAHS